MRIIKSIPPPASAVQDAGEKSEMPRPHLISEARWDSIQLCVHVTRLLGMPRSVCEIFGFVFTSTIPVTFEDIVEGLGMSNGSASHGLRYLRRIGALSVTYFARDRRDYYVPETSLARLASGYLLENVTHHLADNLARISAVRATLGLAEDSAASHLSSRVDILFEWNRQVGAAVNIALAAIAPPATENTR